MSVSSYDIQDSSNINVDLTGDGNVTKLVGLVSA